MSARTRMRTRSVQLVVLALVAACAGGCEKTARNMYEQPRDKALAPSTLWADGRSAREPVAGSIVHSAGIRAATTSGREGTVVPEAAVAPALPSVAETDATADTDIAQRSTWTPAVLARGRERFDIYCAPCHSVAGDGDGMIARRGFPHPPSFHIARLREAPDAHFYSVISDGYGAMYSYANRVPPDDRRAIIAYIRALQLSQHATVADLPPQARARLESTR